MKNSKNFIVYTVVNNEIANIIKQILDDYNFTVESHQIPNNNSLCYITSLIGDEYGTNITIDIETFEEYVRLRIIESTKEFIYSDTYRPISENITYFDIDNLELTSHQRDNIVSYIELVVQNFIDINNGEDGEEEINISDLRTLEGLNLYSNNDFEESIAKFSEAINSNPQNATALGMRGKAYVDIELFDNAISDFKSALDLEPNNIYFHYNLGCAYESKGDYMLAIDSYNSTILLDDKLPDAYLGIAWCYKVLATADPLKSNDYLMLSEEYKIIGDKLKNE